jgi:hypothetical protein
VQGQDANGDQLSGRDFRHQEAQRLEFSCRVTQANRFRPDAKTYQASVARIGATLNC